jgi:hypothetical protein
MLHRWTEAKAGALSWPGCPVQIATFASWWTIGATCSVPTTRLGADTWCDSINPEPIAEKLSARDRSAALSEQFLVAQAIDELDPVIGTGGIGARLPLQIA